MNNSSSEEGSSRLDTPSITGIAVICACVGITVLGIISTRFAFHARAVVVLALGFAVNYFARGIVAGMFVSLEQDLPATVWELGFLITAAEISGAVALLGWGVVCSRALKHVHLVLGVNFAIASLFTFLACGAHSFIALLIMRALAGAALLGISAIASSLLLNLFLPNQRGTVFGVMAMSTAVGSITGTITASLAQGPGEWRYVFIGSSVVLIWYAALGPALLHSFAKNVALKEVGSWLSFLRKRSFALLSITGALNNLPYVSFSFLILWFRYIGFTETQSALILACGGVGLCSGAVVGGRVSDTLYIRSGYKGSARLIMAQCTLGVLATLVLVLMFALPRDPTLLWAYCLMVFSLAFFIVWPDSGCDLVLVAGVIPVESYPAGAACAQFVQALLSGTGALIIGAVAETVFGYEARGVKMEEISPEMRQANLHALTYALASVLLTTWAVQFLLYCILHCTYAADSVDTDPGVIQLVGNDEDDGYEKEPSPAKVWEDGEFVNQGDTKDSNK